MCTFFDSAVTGLPILQGFQVIYGNGTEEKAGPAHGDVSFGCEDFDLTSNVSAVTFYRDNAGTQT